MSVINAILTWPRRRAHLPLRRWDRAHWLTLTLATLMALLLILPVVALVVRTLAVGAVRGSVLDTAAALDALLLSLATTGASMALILLLGTPLALVMARYDFPFKRLLAVFVEMPIVMPPVVAGLALLAAFGRRGLFGSALTELDLSLVFTPAAVIMAQVYVAAPFYVRAAQSRFGALPRELEEAAHIDGAAGWSAFRFVTLPLSARALLVGLVLSWARALGEFGATILFAGNLQQRTQTMPLLVYGALERDLNAAYVTAIVLLALAALALGATRWIGRLDEVGEDPLVDR